MGREEHKQGGGIRNIDGKYTGQLFCVISSNLASRLVWASTAGPSFVPALGNMTAPYLLSQGFSKTIAWNTHWNPFSLYTCAPQKFREVQTNRAITHVLKKKLLISLSAKVWEAFHKAPPMITVDWVLVGFSLSLFESLCPSFLFQGIQAQHRKIRSLLCQEIVHILKKLQDHQ